MASRSVEVATAWVRIMPSLKGFSKELSKALKNAIGEVPKEVEKAAVPIEETLKKAMANGLKVSASVYRPLLRGLSTVATSFGSTLNQTIRTSANLAGTAFGAALATVGTQVVGGGFNRALGIEEARARINALGYDAQRAVASATKAVDGTQFTVAEALSTTAQLLASGLGFEQIDDVLAKTAKLAAISGQSFGDLGNEMSKNAAAGVVQYEDMNRLIERGLPIMQALSKQMGVSIADVRKLGSESKVSFNDFISSIDQLEFDIAGFTENSITSTFTNIRSQLSRIGQSIWTPILWNLTPVLNDVYKVLRDFNTRIQEPMADWGTNVTSGATRFHQQIKDIFGDENGNVSAEFLINSIDKVTDRIKGYWETLDSLQGPIIGALVGIMGSQLSNLPVIGGVFDGLTPAVGIFAGVLIQAYTASDKLKEAVNGLLPNLGDLGLRLAQVFTGDDSLDPASLGDKLADFITNTFSWLNRLVDVLDRESPRILAAFETIGNAITIGMDKIGGDGTGGDVGSGIVKALEITAGLVSSIVPTLAGLASIAVSLINSPAIQGILTGVAWLAGFLVSNEHVLYALATVLAGVFVGSKINKGVAGMTAFIKSLNTSVSAMASQGPVAPQVIKKFGKRLLGMVKEMALLTATILTALAAFVVITAALSLAMPIITQLGGPKLFSDFGTTLVAAIPMIVGLGLFAAASLGLGKLGNAAMKSMLIGGAIITAMAGLLVGITQIAQFAGDISPLAESVKQGLPVLAGILALASAAMLIGILGTGALKAIAMGSLIILAITGLMAIIGAMGSWGADIGMVQGFEALASSIQAVIEVIIFAVDSMITAVMPVLTLALDTVVSIIDIVLNAITSLQAVVGSAVEAVASSIARVAEADASSIAAQWEGLTTLFEVIERGGPGVADSINQVLYALMGLEATSALFSFGSIVDGIGALLGAESPLQQMATVLENLGNFDEIATNLPEKLGTVLESSYEIGLQIPVRLSDGILAGQEVLALAILTAIQASMNQTQEWLDSNPLEIRTSVPDINANAVGAGGAGTNNSTYNKNISVTTSNDSLAKQLIRGSR